MNILGKKRCWIVCTYAVTLLCGIGGFASRTYAQNAATPVVGRSVSIAASTMHGADWVADEALRKRVKAALHADPHFSDKHVRVSVENGIVVLRGFVLNDRDFREAPRIARKAAGDRSVIDSLSIEER